MLLARKYFQVVFRLIPARMHRHTYLQVVNAIRIECVWCSCALCGFALIRVFIYRQSACKIYHQLARIHIYTQKRKPKHSQFVHLTMFSVAAAIDAAVVVVVAGWCLAA